MTLLWLAAEVRFVLTPRQWRHRGLRRCRAARRGHRHHGPGARGRPAQPRPGNRAHGGRVSRPCILPRGVFLSPRVDRGLISLTEPVAAGPRTSTRRRTGTSSPSPEPASTAAGSSSAEASSSAARRDATARCAFEARSRITMTGECPAGAAMSSSSTCPR